MRTYWYFMAACFSLFWLLSTGSAMLTDDGLQDIEAAIWAIPFVLCLRWATE